MVYILPWEEIFAGADIKTTLDKYNEVIQGILK